MHVAIITTWGSAPKYIEAALPAPPDPSSNMIQVRLRATAVHQLVRARAAGKHYSASTLPHEPGVDGTGTLSDGTPVYVSTLSSGQGSFKELINVPKHAVTPLPKGLDLVTAAASINPALSSWMAMRTRVDLTKLPTGFTVVIMGATSTSGSIAVGLVRTLGAGKVIGVGRDRAKLAQLPLDEVVVLAEADAEQTGFEDVGDVDIVLDYLYGPPVLQLLSAIKTNRPLQYVQLGSMAGSEANIPAAIMRSKDITLRGAGPGSWTMDQMASEMEPLLHALVGAEGAKFAVRNLSEVEEVWVAKGISDRLVFLIK